MLKERIYGRESGLELLRILAMLGIITMHMFAPLMNVATGRNLYVGVFINTIFNVGVSCFMLVTGYYGIRAKGERFVSLWLTVFFYSVVSYAVIPLVLGEGFSVASLTKSFLPLAANRYWYMTSFFIIALFSGYIDRMVDGLGREGTRKLLLLLLVVFSAIPTFLYFQVLSDSGKGPVNMFIIYLIGRYLARWVDVDKISVKKTLAALVLLFGSEYVLNISASIFRGIYTGKGGVFAPFARDCSVFTVAAGVLVFVLFKRMKWKSIGVNLLAFPMFGTYLCEGGVRKVLFHFVQPSSLKNESQSYLNPACVVCILLVFMAAGAVEWVRYFCMDHAQNKLARFVCKVFRQGKDNFFIFVEKYRNR